MVSTKVGQTMLKAIPKANILDSNFEWNLIIIRPVIACSKYPLRHHEGE